MFFVHWTRSRYNLQAYNVLYLLLKNGPINLFLFIFALFKYRKIVDFSGIQTQIVGVEGEHPDHLTTTTAVFIIGRMFSDAGVHFLLQGGRPCNSLAWNNLSTEFLAAGFEKNRTDSAILIFDTGRSLPPSTSDFIQGPIKTFFPN